MPIMRGSASFSRFRVDEAKASKAALKDPARALRLRAFVPLERGGEAERAQGFVELEQKDQAEFSPGSIYQGPYALFAYRVDEVRLPAAAVRAELELWEQKFRDEQGRPPGRKEKADAKGEIRHTLRARYPLATKVFEISWNLDAGALQIWAGSRKAVDEVQAALEQALGFKLVPAVPATLAAELGIPEKALAPTPALSGAEEGAHGQA